MHEPAVPGVPRLLMIGLDAADPVCVERWMDDGSLPNLAALRDQGVSGRLDSSARYLAGSPWPTFYTGMDPSAHGFYHDFQWRHEEMGFAAPTEEWLDLKPFWRALEGDVDVVSYDVPFAPTCRPFRGTELNGWASHDKLAPTTSFPADLMHTVRNQFGEWPVSYEGYGPDNVERLLELRQELLDNTQYSAELAAWLLKRPWQFAIVCFSALHRGGHRLWDRSTLEGPISITQGNTFDNALQDLYIACDRAVGQLIAAHSDVTVFVFSTHGMMVNTSRSDLLDGMLARVCGGGEEGQPPISLVRRIGETLPKPWRRAVTRRIPKAIRNSLVTAWSTGAMRWESTPAFLCRADLQGYIRINLLGRETRGIINPGTEHDALCERIIEGLTSFRDADTGERIIEQVCLTDDVFSDGPYRDRLPDLLVLWNETPSANHRAVQSLRYGTVMRSTPGRVPNGRSGNHRGEGILIARGPGIPAGGRLSGRPHIKDLAPTVIARLGVGCSLTLGGHPIAELAELS